MPRTGWVWIATIVAALSSAACIEPPHREIEQARQAIELARTANAAEYANEELIDATRALEESHEAVANGDYRLALSEAIHSRELAQAALSQAKTRRTALMTEAGQAVERLDAALAQAQETLTRARTEQGSASLVQASVEVVEHAGSRVQEARAAFERADYRAVLSIVADALSSVEAAIAKLDAGRAPA